MFESVKKAVLRWIMPRVDNEIKQAEKRNIVKMYAFIGMGGGISFHPNLSGIQ